MNEKLDKELRTLAEELHMIIQQDLTDEHKIDRYEAYLRTAADWGWSEAIKQVSQKVNYEKNNT